MSSRLSSARPTRPAWLTPTVARIDPDGTARYSVDGALFFASSNDLHTQFEYADDPQDVVIDLSSAHVWDASTVAALDAITHKYETRGKRVEIVGLNEHSSDRYERHTGQLSAH